MSKVNIADFKEGWTSIRCGKWEIQYISAGCLSIPNIEKIFSKNIDVNFIEKWLKSIPYFFSIIAESETQIIAAVDRIRAFPVFYSANNSKKLVSNSARKLQDLLGLYKEDKKSVLEFTMAGYVSGNRTMFKGIFQIIPGQCLFINKKENSIQLKRYYLFFSKIHTYKSKSELIKKLNSIHDSLIKGIIDRASGRPIWVPLSGGWDSRLIVSKLAQFKCPNVQTFSYGAANDYESKLAKKVSSCLGLPWFKVDISRKQFKDYFWSIDRKKYFEFSDGLSTLPFVQDSHVIGWLLDTGRMPKDAILVNGQSGDFITGGHMRPEHFEESISREQLIDFLLNTHYSMWRELHKEQNISVIRKRISEVIDNFHVDMGVDGYMAACWEWQERQCKFVVNGQKAYEFYKLDWEMPLWMPEYMDFWKKIPWKYLEDQNLYKECLRINGFRDVFNKISTEVWRWPGASILVVPIARLVGLFFGRNKKNRVYEIAKLFGHYRYSYGAYPIFKCLIASNSIRDVDSLHILTWLQENMPSSAIDYFNKKYD
jgi:asparagine synthase (glutamine-hydrolysing)